MANVIIAGEFSPLRNFRSVAWGDSFRYNIARYLVCGLLLATLSAMTTAQPGDSRAGIFLYMLFGFPLFALIFLFPLATFVRLLARTFPPVALFGLFLGLLTSIGDPIIWLVALTLRNKPWVQSAIPIETPPFFSFQPFIYLLRPTDASEVFYSGGVPITGQDAHSFDVRN